MAQKWGRPPAPSAGSRARPRPASPCRGTAWGAPGCRPPAGCSSFCEGNGPARYWTLVDGPRQLARVAWSYPQPLAGAEALANCVAFYPQHLDCSVDGQPVTPQPGGFYGGWITPELTGPFKGEPGSEGW